MSSTMSSIVFAAATITLLLFIAWIILTGEQAVEDNIIQEHVDREIEQISLAKSWRGVFTPEEQAQIEQIIAHGETLKRKGGRHHRRQPRDKSDRKG